MAASMQLAGADGNHAEASVASAAAVANSNINGSCGGGEDDDDDGEDNDDNNGHKSVARLAASNVASQDASRPLILITGSGQTPPSSQLGAQPAEKGARQGPEQKPDGDGVGDRHGHGDEQVQEHEQEHDQEQEQEQEQEEVVDGIRYRIVAAVTAPAAGNRLATRRRPASFRTNEPSSGMAKKLGQVRRKSSAFVSNLLSSVQADNANGRPRRMSIYEMTKSPPPETSLEVYLSERRRSSTISAKQVQQQLEQQSTFQTNYNQRQQYFKDLNRKLINQDKKLLNVVANRGQIHRHSVDIAQLPLNSAILQGTKAKAGAKLRAGAGPGAKGAESAPTVSGGGPREPPPAPIDGDGRPTDGLAAGQARAINQEQPSGRRGNLGEEHAGRPSNRQHLVAIRENDPFSPIIDPADSLVANTVSDHQRASIGSHRSHRLKSKTVIRKFQKLDLSQLSSTPSPDVKIGQRVAYKEYYGNEFGTIRWIGRVPQISPDWTVGVEFDNAIGEGDGSLHGRRYFIAKDCFAKFLPLSAVALVDQHVGRPEPGTMISVMAAASQPGQMISIQRVSTVHVQHCFLNAPHHRAGADILAVNTRLHCQCPNCGPCAHVIKPPTTQRLARAGKNATHMCQFSTYTCCGMESQEETMCTYTGNKVNSELPPPGALPIQGPNLAPQQPPPPPIGHSWIEGAGYLSTLQAQQRKLMPEEYTFGVAPEDCPRIRPSRSSPSRRGSGKQHKSRHVAAATDEPLGAGPQADNGYAGKSAPGVDATRESHSEHYACLDGANSFSPFDDKQQHEHEQDDEEDEIPKAKVVVYRNSIENRYLFPTDDQIDPSLEEDLENLSQARYGYAAAPPYGSSSSRSRTHRGGLFKSLRSLVSCLNSQSNQSMDQMSGCEIQSEHTLRYSTNREMAHFKNRSEPAAHEQQDCCLYANAAPHPKDDLLPPPLYSSHTNIASSAAQQPFRPDSRTANRMAVDKSSAATMGRQISSSSDCGFSSASQNSMNCLSFAAMSQTGSPMLEDQLRSQQIYRRIVARMMNNFAMITEDDMEKLRQIFASAAGPFEGGSCCLHASTTNWPAANEIDQTIAEIASRSLQLQRERDLPKTGGCCHCSAANAPPDTSSQCCGDKAEPNKPACCLHKTNAHATRRQTDGGSIASDSITSSSFGSSVGNASHPNHLPANQEQQQQQQPSVKLEPRKEVSRKNDDNTNLPKAFELKLTLSINSDGKPSLAGAETTKQQSSSAVRCKLNEPAEFDLQDEQPVLDLQLGSPGGDDKFSGAHTNTYVDQGQRESPSQQLELKT